MTEARAFVDYSGRFLGGDRSLFAAAVGDGMRAGDAARVGLPACGREAWLVDIAHHRLLQLRPDDDRWVIEDHDGVDPDCDWADLARADVGFLAAVTQAGGLDGAVSGLASEFVRRSGGILLPAIVLIDPEGNATFAGGRSIVHSHLTAMERARRNGAPLAIWQAFEEDRVIVDPNWFETVREDERFAPVAEQFPPAMRGTYVAIPMRWEQRPIGVLSGVLDRATSVTPASLLRLCLLTDRLVLALRYSESLRRARAQSAEAARTRLHHDLHASVAQDVFILSLEIARLVATAPEGESRLAAAQELTEKLLLDIRAVIDEPRDESADHGDPLRLRLLTGSEPDCDRVRIDDGVDWNPFTSRFVADVERIAVEAVRNALRHSRPGRIVVTTRIDASTGWVELEVGDPGPAHPVVATVTSGRGLTLIERVVEARGGRLRTQLDGPGPSHIVVTLPPEHESEWAVAQRDLESDAE